MSDPVFDPKGPGPGLPAGVPAEMPALPEGQPFPIPPGELPPGLPLEAGSGKGPLPAPGGGKIRMKTMPRMNARPYLKRAIGLLAGHKALVAFSLFLSLIIFLLPFLAAAAFGPLLKLFGEAATGGDWSKVWTMTGSFYDTSGAGA